MPEELLLDQKTLIEGLLKIKDKRGDTVPFILNPAQRYYWERKTRRNLVLKARQKGLSKIIDADQLIDCVRKPTSAVIISHEKEATTRMFKSVRGFIDSMDKDSKPAISIDSRSEIQFPKRGSSYFIGTAGQKAFGRGDTIDRVHLSEAAFYENLERILGGIAEAAEYGQIDIETTPNGRNEIYDMWQKAKAGKSSYTPIFIPWFIDGEYSIDNLTEKEKQGLSVSVQEMFLIPDKDFQFTKEEQELITKVKKEWNIILTIGQIKWRKYKMWDKGEMFFQEYPEDDVSCFLQTGRSVFSKITKDKSKQIPLDDLESWNASEDEKELLKGRRMYAGIDGAEGTPTGDAHCFAVIDIPEGDGKGTVIYEYTTNEPIDKFWQVVKTICENYDILLGIEKNGVGLAHIRKAQVLGIPFKSWTTTGANRPTMLLDLEEAYRKAELIETYDEAENEARDMEYGENSRAEAKKGKHDDRIFARAIAWGMREKNSSGLEYL